MTEWISRLVFKGLCMATIGLCYALKT